MKKIEFHKIEATGNDFIVIDNRDGLFEVKDSLKHQIFENLCQRRTGIGADGVLLLGEDPRLQSDYIMTYYNADGSKAKMCGNGARALSFYAHHVLKLKKEPRYKFEVEGLTYHSEILDGDSKGAWVKVRMRDVLDIERIEFNSLTSCNIESLNEMYLNTGVPHYIIEVGDLLELDVVDIGRKIRQDPTFPEGVNVDFFEIMSSGKVLVRTYERGVEDETKACGTGALAVAVGLLKFHKTHGEIDLQFPGGEITVSINKDLSELFLGGLVKKIFSGIVGVDI